MSFYKHSDNVHVLHVFSCLPDFNLTEHAWGVLQTSKLLDTSNNSVMDISGTCLTNHTMAAEARLFCAIFIVCKSQDQKASDWSEYLVA